MKERIIIKMLTLPAWALFLLSLTGYFGAVKTYGPFFAMLYWLLLMGYIYCLGTRLYARLPKKHDLNINRFKKTILLPTIYPLVFFVLFFFNKGHFFDYLGYLMPFHFATMAILLYDFYFIAKTLKTIEKGKSAVYSEYIGTLFSLIYFAIGVWWTQPRISKVFSDDTNSGHLSIA